MMYRNNLVVCIKVAGKILRESGDAVTLPFGSEYSILIKNLESRRAMAKVSVDGTDATDGTRLIVPANGSIELERYIRNGNLSEGNRFKFIERTEQIEQHRGIQADDGLIRVERWLEQAVQEIPVPQYTYYHHPWPVYPDRRRHSIYDRATRTLMHGSRPTASGRPMGASMRRPMHAVNSVSFTNTTTIGSGITVAGSHSQQQFQSSYGFPLEANSDVITLRLRGAVGKVAVAEPVTVAAKRECSTCGRTNKANSQFCSQCGTSLMLA